VEIARILSFYPDVDYQEKPDSYQSSDLSALRLSGRVYEWVLLGTHGLPPGLYMLALIG